MLQTARKTLVKVTAKGESCTHSAEVEGAALVEKHKDFRGRVGLSHSCLLFSSKVGPCPPTGTES